MSKFVEITTLSGDNIILNVDCIKSIKNLYQDTDAGEEEAEKKNRQNGYGKDGKIYCYEPELVVIETTDDEIIQIRYDSDSAGFLRGAIDSKDSSGFFGEEASLPNKKYKFIEITAFHDDNAYTDVNGDAKHYKRNIVLKIDTIERYYFDIDPLTKKQVLIIVTSDGQSFKLSDEDYIETRTWHRKKYTSRKKLSDAKLFLNAINSNCETGTLKGAYDVQLCLEWR